MLGRRAGLRHRTRMPTHDAEDAAVTDETPVGDARLLGSAGPSRRTVLVASGAALSLLLTACKGMQALGTPPPPPRDIRVLRAAITAEELIVATYAAAITRLPASAGSTAGGLQAAVHAVQAEHSAHLSQLRSRLIEPAGQPTPPARRPPALVAGGSVSSLITALEQAEQAASDRLLGQLPGLPAALAQLFASIAASEATHVPLLQQVAAAAR
jgi:Ferritin-like domain